MTKLYVIDEITLFEGTYAPMIYMALCEMFLMQANPLRGQN